MPRPGSECQCVICRAREGVGSRTSFDERLVGNIAEYGWGVVMIGPDASSEGWAFTVGLWHTHRIPELAVFGLDLAVMKTTVNLTGHRLVDGAPATAGTRIDGVLNDFPILIQEADPLWHGVFFGTALRFYGETALVPFRQVLWPDKTGTFPHESGFAAQLAIRQPSLWLHPLEHDDGPWTAQLRQGA